MVFENKERKKDIHSKKGRSSNGSTKSHKSTKSGGTPLWQMLLGFTLVVVAGVAAAIALGVISVDEIKDSPVWISAKAFVDQALGKDGPDTGPGGKQDPPKAKAARRGGLDKAEPKEDEEEEAETRDPLMSAEDQKISKEIVAAEKLLQQKKTEPALRKFEGLIQKHPLSPRARYGRAQALDQLAEEQRSNELLKSAIIAYGEVKDALNCPDEVKKAAMRRRAERMSFMGKTRAAADVLQSLSQEFPEDLKIRKELGVQYLIMGQDDRAKPCFEQVLKVAPNDGFAKVHLGFIVKREGNFEEAIQLLEEGLASNEEGTSEGKYFFHLGDAYQRTGRINEAYRVYEDAAQRGLFRSAMQRSLYNVDNLHGQPWWTAKEAKIESAVKKLEDNWKVIQKEALALMNKETKLFEAEEESLQDTGDWKQYMLYMRGTKDQKGCSRTPKTCEIIDSIPDSAGCKRGQVKFSVMHPGTHVWPHTGPTNCRLRSHLGLVVPGGSRIRVVNETRTWEEGKVLIFDDSFEHEVWQEAESYRLVLIVDFWHPELTENQKRYLSPI
ncbi:Aspartyl/asparaginyl beta-hydroxylase [Apostichopus japonicus]|uniref:Aspartyl/asparaginyl beta-hydroxylase n=1 Tax=Stichopus japonicus TaxID=307972 RepID=A0A2G8KTD8_STIJA|nr:Aspartyl/asparaginyl beta-hydroxylase [Apostichopus japonicus]